MYRRNQGWPTMHGAALPLSPVAELEARQDEVLRLLDELNQRIEWALFELGVVSSSKPALVPVMARTATDR
jgi:hypothetical protein